MRTQIKVRQIQEQSDRQSGEIRFYMEFEFIEPATIERVNISSLDTDEKNKYKSFVGKEILISIQQGEYNGTKFWRLFNGGNPQEISLKSVPNSRQAAA